MIVKAGGITPRAPQYRCPASKKFVPLATFRGPQVLASGVVRDYQNRTVADWDIGQVISTNLGRLASAMSRRDPFFIKSELLAIGFGITTFPQQEIERATSFLELLKEDFRNDDEVTPLLEQALVEISTEKQGDNLRNLLKMRAGLDPETGERVKTKIPEAKKLLAELNPSQSELEAYLDDHNPSVFRGALGTILALNLATIKGMSPLEYLEQAWKTTTIYQFNSILTAFKMVQGKKIAKLEQELGIVKSESTTETGLGQFTAEISGTTPDIIRTLGTIGNRNIENGSVIIDKDWIGTAKRQIQAMIEQDALSVETLEACLTHLHPAVRLGALRTIYKLKPETIRGVPTLDFLLEMYTKDQDGWLTIPLLKAIIVAQKARIEELLAIRDAG